jgi:hypothetical protein
MGWVILFLGIELLRHVSDGSSNPIVVTLLQYSTSTSLRTIRLYFTRLRHIGALEDWRSHQLVFNSLNTLSWDSAHLKGIAFFVKSLNGDAIIE